MKNAQTYSSVYGNVWIFVDKPESNAQTRADELNQEIIERIPMKRWGKANEINGILDFLISSNASYITGQVLNVDGGWTS